MGIRIGICQLAGGSSAEENLKRVEGAIMQNKADLYVFPELYLTGYTSETFDPEDVATAVSRLQVICNNRDCAVALGAPMQWYNGVTDSLIFVTPNETYRYDKLYLAKFGCYDESRFEKGHAPMMVSFKGMKIGFEICYDAFFPEIHRFYAVHGADMVVVISASAKSSERAFRTVLPASSLENTVYTVFCNSCGPYRDDNPFYGGSALYSPLGEEIASAGAEEQVVITYADPSVVEHAREERPQLRDLRDDIRWIL